MAQMDKTYINEMQKQFGYHPAWAPNRPYELGDYGDPQHDQFEMLGNIRKWVTPKPSRTWSRVRSKTWPRASDHGSHVDG